MLRETLGIAPGHFILPRQVHGNGIAIVDEHFLKMSSDEQKEAVSQADALITNIPEVCIGVTTAVVFRYCYMNPVKKWILQQYTPGGEDCAAYCFCNKSGVGFSISFFVCRYLCGNRSVDRI